MDDLLNEVLDENTKTYPAVNLKPKAKVPQIWKFDVPGNDTLMARLVSFQSDGDVVKAVKMGDKYAQLFLMSLSDKGNAGELRGGLGSDPMGAIATIFDTVAETAKKYRIDAVLFRLPIKKMKGQHMAVQRVLTRLAKTRTGGRYVVLKELWNHSKKYAYVLIHRKNVVLDEVPGIPEISKEIFTAVETAAGIEYVDKKSSTVVTKAEALAITIATTEDARTNDRSVAARTKISRRDAIRAQYGEKGTVPYSDEAQSQFDKLIDSPPVKAATEAPAKQINQLKSAAWQSIQGEIDEYNAFEMTGKGNIPEILNHLDRSVKTSINKAMGVSFSATPGQLKRAKESKDKIIKDYMGIISQFNGSNVMDIYRDLAKNLFDNLGLEGIDSATRREIIKEHLEVINMRVLNSMGSQYATMGFGDVKLGDFSSEEQKAIAYYCKSGYNEINDFLIGEDSSVKSIREGTIPALDSAFDKGQTLPKGTTLYRGHRMKKDVFTKTIENKLFYFTNYVSTSVAPGIFGLYGNAYAAVDPNVDVVDIDATEDAHVPVHLSADIKVGFVINGADKIKTLIPIGITTYPEECEVILPRGTCLRINKVYSKALTDQSAIFESTVLTPEQLDESDETIYDGDKLFETGEIVAASGFSFSDFVAKEDEAAVQSMQDAADQVMDILVEMVDFSKLSDKFIG